MPRGGSESCFSASDSRIEIECRFSTRNIQEMFLKLNKDQKDLVSRVGFGNLFDFTMVKRTDRHQIIWLLDSWDTARNVINIDPDHQIPVSPDEVHRILGLPNGSIPVTGADEFDKSLCALRLRKILGVHPKAPMLPMKDIEGIVLNTDITEEQGQERFLVAFLCYIVGNFLAPRSGYQKVQPEVSPAVTNPFKSREYSWCRYIFDELRDGAEKVQRSLINRQPVPLQGCMLLLQVLYWESLPVCRALIADDDTTPRAPLYTSTIIGSIFDMDPNLTKLDKCRAFFQKLPPTQNKGVDGRGRKRGRRPNSEKKTVENTLHSQDALTTAATGNDCSRDAFGSSSSCGGLHADSTSHESNAVEQVLNVGVSQTVLISSQHSGGPSEYEPCSNVILHHFGAPVGTKPAEEFNAKITCSNWVLEKSNPQLGACADKSAEFALWIQTSTAYCSEFYWDWIVHYEHRAVALLGERITDVSLDLSPIDHDLCEISIRMFRKYEQDLCECTTVRPCRYFLSPDWARFVDCGVDPSMSDHFADMFSAGSSTPKIDKGRMVTTVIQIDKRWCCYCWDLLTRRLTIMDPQMSNSEIDEVRSRHYTNSAKYHAHLMRCMEVYCGISRKDVLDWEIILLGDILPDPKRDVSALYSLYYSLEFDGIGFQHKATRERICQFKTALLYQLVHIDGNKGRKPKIQLAWMNF